MCYRPKDQISYEDLEAKESLVSGVVKLQKALDERTAMLCEAMGIVTDAFRKIGKYPEPYMSKELTEWWQAHQRWDAERREQGR